MIIQKFATKVISAIFVCYTTVFYNTELNIKIKDFISVEMNFRI